MGESCVERGVELPDHAYYGGYANLATLLARRGAIHSLTNAGSDYHRSCLWRNIGRRVG